MPHHNANSPLPWYGVTGILVCVVSVVVLTVLHLRQRRTDAKRQKLAAASPGAAVAGGRR